MPLTHPNTENSAFPDVGVNQGLQRESGLTARDRVPFGDVRPPWWLPFCCRPAVTHSTVSVEENRGTDQRLIRGLVARDPGAAEELISRYGRVMFSLSCRIAKDSFLAEDAVQDACLQVWRDAVQYDAARGSVQAWLLVITDRKSVV